MKNWTVRDMASQQGRLAVITGATGGLGYETVLALAGAGARVVLTGRNPAKGATALQRIRAVHAGADICYDTLDLGSLASIQDFAERFKRKHDALDILVNNGGVMAPPTRQVTADGFELQFGTNYLSHFALTAHLLPLLTQGRRARVVNLSSMAHRFGASIHFDDLNWAHSYRAFAAYGQSKLAMLMFTFELQRRSDEHGWGLLSLAAHPGLAATELLQNGQSLGGNSKDKGKAGWIETFSSWMPSVLAQSASDGALPTLYAATSPDAVKAGYYGPTGFMELKGGVGEATVASRARDQAVAARLWAVSETLTGVRWTAAPVMTERSFA
ncbi:MAG: SDR family oxidoreductase [Burkholderiaceae bacterium]|nr:SDR family oxidoreductase [Burkholderiaceae bacterium]